METIKQQISRTTLIILLLITFFLNIGCTKGNGNIDKGLAKQLQTTLEQIRDSYSIPGISAALITANGQKWLGVCGYSAEKDSMKPEMLFGLASVTKTYVAALLMKLVEEKKLSLDDSIKQWLPSMRFVDGTITIRQLLNHTSGLYRHQYSPKLFKEITTNDDKIWRPEEIIATFLDEPVGKPGSVWGEAAADYILLGMIIEKATGKKAANLLREKIILPLNLKHTYLYPDEINSSEKLAHFWWDTNRTGKLVDVFPVKSRIPLASMFSSWWTSGAIFSTAEDLAIFSKALFERGILSDSSFKQMIAPIQIGNSPKYGFSVVIDTIEGKTVYWHNGGAGYMSVFYYIPDDKLSIAVLCNSFAVVNNSFVDPKDFAVKLYKEYKKSKKWNPLGGTV
jgi:D-alanyl-D-alanine carboxypeptidase